MNLIGHKEYNEIFLDVIHEAEKSMKSLLEHLKNVHENCSEYANTELPLSLADLIYVIDDIKVAHIGSNLRDGYLQNLSNHIESFRIKMLSYKPVKPNQLYEWRKLDTGELNIIYDWKMRRNDILNYLMKCHSYIDEIKIPAKNFIESVENFLGYLHYDATESYLILDSCEEYQKKCEPFNNMLFILSDTLNHYHPIQDAMYERTQ